MGLSPAALTALPLDNRNVFIVVRLAPLTTRDRPMVDRQALFPETIEMIRAGTDAYRARYPDAEDPEAMVAPVFFAMRDASGHSTRFELPHPIRK